MVVGAERRPELELPSPRGGPRLYCFVIEEVSTWQEGSVISVPYLTRFFRLVFYRCR